MSQNQISNTLTVELHSQILKVCHKMELSLHDNNLGPKIFTNYQRVALIILFHRSGKNLRRFTSELFESKWVSWLGLKQVPSYRSIHEWCVKFDLLFLRIFNQVILENQKPSLMAIDATGIDSWQRSRHYEKRCNEFRRKLGIHKEHMPYAKVDLLVDTDTLLIHDFVLRTKPRHDVLGASTIFKRCKYKEVLVLMDKGYDSEPLHELAAKNNIKSYAPVRNFHVKKVGGKHRRRCFSEPPNMASRRCLIESVNRSLKSRFRSLKSKLSFQKKREFAWYTLIYNLEILAKQAKACLWLICQAVILNRAHN